MSRTPQAIFIPPDALVILCGPAGCGKSDFAHRHFRRVQIVSSDECRALVSDDEADLSASWRAFDLFHKITEHRLALRRLTVADSTALSSGARADLRRLARRARRPAVLIAFDVSAAFCIGNNRKRDRRVPIAVIREHRRRFRAELARFRREGYDGIYILTARTARTASVHVGEAKIGLRWHGL